MQTTRAVLAILTVCLYHPFWDTHRLQAHYMPLYKPSTRKSHSGCPCCQVDGQGILLYPFK